MISSLNLSPDFWRGKRVLLTGHTGFKGAWLSLWLAKLGANVSGIALEPNTSPSLFALAKVEKEVDSFFCDIRDAKALSKIVKSLQPEIVFHLAAQALVRASYQDPVGTFSTNIMGTVNLLDALRGLTSLRVVIMVTTDKVYQNNEWHLPYREDDLLGGHDPYSASKAASEIVIASYRAAFLKQETVAVSSARAGNVIGGGDWSEDRLLPDAVRAWQSGETLEIRRPDGIRPWQHVLEPLAGYMTLAKKMWDQPELAGAFNFGPKTDEAATVREVVEVARAAYGSGNVNYGDGNQGPHEAGWLSLETAKARIQLGIRTKWSLRESVQRAMSWYREQNKGADTRLLCLTEIAEYETQK